MNNTTTRNKVWTFCVIYLGYMLLFADRTVFNLALAASFFLRRGFASGFAAAKKTGSDARECERVAALFERRLGVFDEIL